jgi:hypothetical protein
MGWHIWRARAKKAFSTFSPVKAEVRKTEQLYL